MVVYQSLFTVRLCSKATVTYPVLLKKEAIIRLGASLVSLFGVRPAAVSPADANASSDCAGSGGGSGSRGRRPHTAWTSHHEQVFDCGGRHRRRRSPAVVYSAAVVRQGLGPRLPAAIHQRDAVLDRSPFAQGVAAAGRGLAHNAHRRAPDEHRVGVDRLLLRPRSPRSGAGAPARTGWAICRGHTPTAYH
ncbi:hypothetical protein EVAR_744_1 [Eumeta japonica]|uniref:Uncharacterized protein n=1 Tax=Eumeta variegata TaxID=151549 RepID=A0A4C1SES7_EUMVA|nr:hypothetical protein EVAR_744_1 [Eumeta japonica]